ncbi:MAG: protein kinase [Lentisphaeria bacterium]|nr:protein kinase [Lentisphaeria bacterium]
MDIVPKFVHTILLSFVALLPVSVDVWADAPTHALILCNVKDVNCLIDGKLSRFDKEISGYPDPQTGEWHSGKWYALYAPLDAAKPMTVACSIGILKATGPNGNSVATVTVAPEADDGIALPPRVILSFPPWVVTAAHWADRVGMDPGQFLLAVTAAVLTVFLLFVLLLLHFRKRRLPVPVESGAPAPGQPVPRVLVADWPLELQLSEPGLTPIKTLGAGGIGRIFLCQDEGVSDKMALKVIHEHLSYDDNLKARFLDEFTILEHLAPSGVAPKPSRRSESGFERPWFTMEALDDMVELRDWLSKHDNERPPLDWARALILELGETINRMHKAGVIHRDLSPDNVFFKVSGGKFVVKIIDYGGAKAFGKNFSREEFLHNVTQGEVMGKIHYSPPEQMISGGAAKADERSDYYAYGVTAWRIISGRYPFSGSSISEIRSAHGKGLNDATPLRDVGVSKEIAETLMGLIQPKVEDRTNLAEVLKRLKSRPFTSGRVATVSELSSAPSFIVNTTPPHIPADDEITIASVPDHSTVKASENEPGFADEDMTIMEAPGALSVACPDCGHSVDRESTAQRNVTCPVCKLVFECGMT